MDQLRRSEIDYKNGITIVGMMTVSKRSHSARVALRVVGAAAAGVAAGIVAFAAAGAAVAQPPPPDQCSPAAMMRAHAAAMTQMADYLDSHPDVQQAFTDARSKATPQEREAAVEAYIDTHPDAAAAFQNMHQPVEDLSARCGMPMQDMMPGGMMPGGMMPGGMAPGEMGPAGMPPGGMGPGGMAPEGMGPGGMAPGQ